jgi:hypothetical protein
MSPPTSGFRTGVHRARETRQGHEPDPVEVIEDGRTGSRSSGHRIVAWFVLVAAALYSWFAASTTPFTTAANVMTGVPLIVALVLAPLFAYRNRTPGRSRQSRSQPTVRSLWPWWSIFALVVAWELFCYFELPRYAHPTVSSLYDSASRLHPLKAALFLGWLALGWGIVRSYGRART